MSKYSKFVSPQVKPRRWRIHPIWRGIGLVLVVIIPVMSWIGASMLIEANKTNQYINIPVEMSGALDYSFIPRLLPALTDVVAGLPRLEYLQLAVTLILIVLAFAALSILYSLLYSMMGPSRYGPYDAPPVRSTPHRRPR